MIVQGREQWPDSAGLYGLGEMICDESGCYDDGSSLPTTNVPDTGTSVNINSGFPSGPGYATVTPSPSSGSSASNSNWFNSLINSVGAAGSKILTTRYSVPQLNAGQYIQSTPYGTTMYQQPSGTPVSAAGSGLSGGSTSLFLMLGIGIVAVMALKR